MIPGNSLSERLRAVEQNLRKPKFAPREIRPKAVVGELLLIRADIEALAANIRAMNETAPKELKAVVPWTEKWADVLAPRQVSPDTKVKGERAEKPLLPERGRADG